MLLKRDEVVPKRGQRWLTSTAISNNIITTSKHLPSFKAVPVLPEFEPVGSSQAALHVHCEMGLRVSAPPVSCTDKPRSASDKRGEHLETAQTQSHASPPITTAYSHGSSPTAPGLEADTPGSPFPLNVVCKKMMSMASCSVAMT